ncbi:hypothetical protein [Paenibacillus antarcticus]|uniref:Uncharacterized protein n=2 Tax=Paenibacillus antarcticus TaxID=253703 RepID=A0A168M054_9BACL|nr:hypothetical protein [Paenibacillus antarcticus]OAB44068.1 hypothetical protein PBAT_15740 [Paenibacillus antarcticus]
MTTMKRLSTLFLSLMLTLTLVTLFPISVLAASFELSTSARTAFDKMAASANSSSANLMNNQYANILKLQQQDQEWDNKIKDLHYLNEETLIVVKKKIQLVDSDKLTNLQAKLTQARERYKPLFSMYESLNQQKAVAKKLNHKEIYNLLLSQTESMKIAVQLARTDIRNKESSYTTAKSKTAATKKLLRATLDGIAPLKVQIKVSKNAASMTQKKFITETLTLKQSIKNGNISTTLRSLDALVTHAKKVIEHKEKTYLLEQKISEIERKVQLQLAS